MKITGETHIGLVRQANEDALDFDYFGDGNCWAVVCDGMGGVSGGQLASSICVEKVSEALKRGYRNGMNDKNAQNLLLSAISAANSAVFKKGQESRMYSGMGTTVVAVIVLGSVAVIGHVGDSRAYILDDECIKPVTKDHSFVQLLIDTGRLTEEEAKYFPDRNVITRAVGIEYIVDADFDIVNIEPNQRLLICSDGLCGYVEDADILKIVNEYGDSSAEQLIAAANNAGGRDNVTVVIINPEVQGE